ncbi:uncharacterized protein UV8b_03203 [Ustilaginoidea virens]|uniref:MYND-type zinc finger protein samB n=1 Tax=Ustilaginoidea virens TaxID=1159556 RepID=A0A063BUB8_USTVR|nr:uncharacterized protein UV8b_03203 [Ustilaginoidea virens]QUC18962.1 hypothetical protein UV8b_03203 [Ustilaginoidea virens]GAO19879.1 hypothetical protein UVI_02030430 [Ustilaginoidea virens]
MREVNFSIPNVNKASVGITTALYDRRALDCTSTLPLINSLNHLAYLTTSSARIRDILTVDGGIERLVCILKQGRSKDMMGMWKWNLAFQCVVNIGVRGTENVRTRVVEADMVPVIATILDNYIKIIEKCREKAEEASQKEGHEHNHRRHRGHDHRSSSKTSASFPSRSTRLEPDQRSFRRHGPPPSIDVSATYAGPSTTALSSVEPTNLSSRATTTTPDRPRATTGSHRRYSFRGTDSRSVGALSGGSSMQPLATAMLAVDSIDTFVRPARDSDRLASLSLFNQIDNASQPTSPTSPLPPPQLQSSSVGHSPAANDAVVTAVAAAAAAAAAALDATERSRRRPSIRHQNSTVETDDMNADSMPSDESPDADMTGNTEIQSTVGIQDISMEDGDSMLPGSSLELTTPTVSHTHQDTDAFNITHRTGMDGSLGNTANPAAAPPTGLSPNRPAIVTPPQPQVPSTTVPRYLLDRHFSPTPQMLAVMPREEDVLMSLQLLAYVSKYCGLRSYFQRSHLVPKLSLGTNLALLDGDDEAMDADDVDESDEEYLLPNDFNLFPLVEKFTVRYHSTDMQYWAGVVMRNLCRKDDTRGGIRQCAYYQCGKWEEYTRQFAKCRRCRRTKYCSKECQKSAWAFHRHWCVAASQ